MDVGFSKESSPVDGADKGQKGKSAAPKDDLEKPLDRPSQVVHKRKVDHDRVSISLSKFLEPYGLPEESDSEEPIGISHEDVISLRFQNYVNSVLNAIAGAGTNAEQSPREIPPSLVIDPKKKKPPDKDPDLQKSGLSLQI